MIVSLWVPSSWCWEWVRIRSILGHLGLLGLVPEMAYTCLYRELVWGSFLMKFQMHGRKYRRFIQNLEGLLEAAEAKCPKEVLGSAGSRSCLHFLCSARFLFCCLAFWVMSMWHSSVSPSNCFGNFILFGILCVMWVDFCVRSMCQQEQEYPIDWISLFSDYYLRLVVFTYFLEIGYDELPKYLQWSCLLSCFFSVYFRHPWKPKIDLFF